MKELSIAEKARRYDEAIKRLEDINTGKCKATFIFTEGLFEYIFPELKESEDEASKKWILEYLYDGLRKSDEQIKNQFKAAVAWLEKQGEQKPADKVEPKFKVGDWVVHNISNEIFLIKSINSGYCTLEDIKGNIMSPCLFLDETEFHLWTLQDAKDGDVLKEDSCTFIIERMKSDGAAIVHCCLFDDGDFDLVGSTLGFDIDSTYPATKEQRGLLFREMEKAGYEWDSEHKQLKKIEQKNPINKVKPKFNIGDTMRTLQEASNGITNGLPVVVSIDDEYYHCTNELIAIKDQDEYEYPAMNRRQNPAWSEEDKNLMYDTLSNLTELKDRYGEGYGNVGKCVDWLKSIKDRVQPQSKQEWSEEDERILKGIIGLIDHGQHYGVSNSEMLNWIKSFRHKSTWKPSERQIASITCAVRKMKESPCYDSELVSLLNDLKKLKKE